MSVTFWAQYAWLPHVNGPVVERDVLIGTVDGGRIAKVTPDSGPCPSGAVRLEGLLVPGQANAHSHAFHRALRGAVQVGSGTFWTWRDTMYKFAGALDPDSYLALATAVYAEMALAGITAVGEFHYLHHAPGGDRYDDPNAMGEALIEAAARALRSGSPCWTPATWPRASVPSRPSRSCGSATVTRTPGPPARRR